MGQSDNVIPLIQKWIQWAVTERDKTNGIDTMSENPMPQSLVSLRPFECNLPQSVQREEERKESRDIPPKHPISEYVIPFRVTPRMKSQRERRERERTIAKQSTNPISQGPPPRLTPRMAAQRERREREKMEAKDTSATPKPESRPTKYMLSQSTQRAEERNELRDFPPKLLISQGATPVRLRRCMEAQRKRRERERMEAKNKLQNPKPELRPTECTLSQSTEKAEERKEAKDTSENSNPEMRPTECMLSQSIQKAEEKKESRDIPPKVPILQDVTPLVECERERERKEAKDTSSENPKPVLSQSSQGAEERKDSTDISPKLSISQGVTPVRLAPCMEAQRDKERMEAKDTSENPKPELRPAKCMLSQSTQKAKERKEAKDTSENSKPELRPTECMLSQSTQKAEERKESKQIPPKIPISQGVSPHLESQRERERKEAKDTSSENPKPQYSLRPIFMSAQGTHGAEERKESRDVPPKLPIHRGFIPMTLTARMKSQRERRERERKKAKVIASQPPSPCMISQGARREGEKGEEKHTTPIPPIQTQYFKAQQKQQYSVPSIIIRRTAFQGFRREGERNIAVNSTSLHPSKVTCCASSSSSTNKHTDKSNPVWSVQREETSLAIYSAGQHSRQKLPVKRKKVMAPIHYSTLGVQVQHNHI